MKDSWTIKTDMALSVCLSVSSANSVTSSKDPRWHQWNQISIPVTSLPNAMNRPSPFGSISARLVTWNLSNSKQDKKFHTIVESTTFVTGQSHDITFSTEETISTLLQRSFHHQCLFHSSTTERSNYTREGLNGYKHETKDIIDDDIIVSASRSTKASLAYPFCPLLLFYTW